MLTSWNLNGIVNALGAKAQAAAAVEAVLEPTLACHVSEIAPKRQRLLEPAARRPSAKDHAQAHLDWLHANIDPSDHPITHAAMLEFYTEMLIELDWAPLPWNPVAHQFRLLTTGKRKVYAWITTTTGARHRLRVYPIPTRAVDAVSTPVTKSKPTGSRSASTLRRAA
jgi:hypothetical protein